MWKYLPCVMREPANLGARTEMMMAAIMGAVAFQKGLGATHSLAHPLSTVAGMHHGAANAVMLPFVIEFNRPVAAERLRELASRLDATRPEEVSDRVRELNRIAAFHRGCATTA